MTEDLRVLLVEIARHDVEHRRQWCAEPGEEIPPCVPNCRACRLAAALAPPAPEADAAGEAAAQWEHMAKYRSEHMAALAAALKPFADYAAVLDPSSKDEYGVIARQTMTASVTITVGDCRRAVLALREHGPKE